MKLAAFLVTASLVTLGAWARAEATRRVRVLKQNTAKCDDNGERDFTPVCGPDGITYGNVDFAHCESSAITKKPDGDCIENK
ncbi:Epi5-like protease inhibitor [Phytophthora infestans T30-4]|uniref:Epi5-like protease inhibitor n=2 Tax=Phytophthora infestans TaxID=4787 RepID=D0N117_PHYIT|nr:Epi5-like protease inhibitor [Phytophthora infestans T30-4]EEY67330.1 Epi5-like protease inhibitor [Phytophthora infestans T30-4]KAF4135750.1 hypothetical protein GN958_ATG15058 [Phytophthora infestans]KAF4140023.1 hypothetical protein GN958_ATG10773 [Phytophthora infestans]|eukprot:XP_002905978.1 Epi5-like protease inhibitor [Phytophthora infestans T30-4]